MLFGIAFQVAEYSGYNFGATTTIHGVRYILNRQSSLISKCVWSVWVVISFICCLVLLANVWSRMYSDPLIVSLSDKPEPIWEIPFPAVTICPETKSKQTVFNFTRMYNVLMKNKLNTIKEEKNFE